MAGASESEEGDYWPGYVDALTAMVKVLTFVMMLLAVAVFAISQKVSKQAVEQIAKAAHIDVQAEGGLQAVTDQVIEALKEHKEHAGKPPEAPPPDAEAMRKALEALAKAANVPVPTAAAPDEAVKALLEKMKQAAVDPSAPVGGTVIESQKQPEQASKAGAVKTERTDVGLTIQFSNGVFRLDQQSSDEVKSFVGGATAGKYTVLGLAKTAGAGLSESRRVAFYRAMVVRQSMVASGIPAEQITVTVKDTNEVKDNDQVRILRN